MAFRLPALVTAQRFCAALALALVADAACADNIAGAGSTFAYPIYAKWANAYQQQSGIGMNYQAIGSGGGIKKISKGSVDFGASDAPLPVEELRARGLVQFPTLMGGVVPVVHVAGIRPGELRLTGALLSDIYLGKVAYWDDTAIAKLNPDLQLPHARITTVYRQDASGTTFIFTHYLCKTNPEFRVKVGTGTSVDWPTGMSGKGNGGVAAHVQEIEGAIGYVEYAYALEKKMTYALMQNRSGRFVTPNIDSFRAAAANADWAHMPGFDVVLTNQRGEASWPITGATFVLLQATQDRADAARQVLRFFDWGYRNGGPLADQLNYVTLPDSVIQLVEDNWSKNVRDRQGQPIWKP